MSRLAAANALATFRGERQVNGRNKAVHEFDVPVLYYPSAAYAQIEVDAVHWRYVVHWAPDAGFSQASGAPFADGDTIEIPGLEVGPAATGQRGITLANVHLLQPAHAKATIVAYLSPIGNV